MEHATPCIIDVKEFTREARGYAQLVKLEELLVEKRMMSIFIVDKKQNKIKRKDYIIMVLSEFGVHVQHIVKEKDFSCPH